MMDRRRFLTFGLATAALTTLSGCGCHRGFFGSPWCSKAARAPDRIHYSHEQYTTVKLFQNGKTFLLLSPDFHLVGTYQPDEFFIDSGTYKTVPISEVPFANLPDSLLKRAYIKYGKWDNKVFRVDSNHTQTAFRVVLAWLKSELSQSEIKRLDSTIAAYQAQLDKLDVPSYTRSLNSSELRQRVLDYVLTTSYYTNHQHELLPALRDRNAPAYGISTDIKGELYAPSTYPAGFFDDGAKNVAYDPVGEASDREPTESLTKTYAWQSRPSPVKISANGQVTLNGKVFKHLSLRSVLKGD